MDLKLSKWRKLAAVIEGWRKNNDKNYFIPASYEVRC